MQKTNASWAQASLVPLREAEPLIETKREPRLFYGLRHDLVYSLATAGRFTEAKGLLLGLWEYRPSSRQPAGPCQGALRRSPHRHRTG